VLRITLRWTGLMRASYRQAIVPLLTVGQLAISGEMFAETAELILYRLFTG